MKKYLHELIGTFFTVLVAILATNHPDWKSQAPWVIGAVYFALLAIMGSRPTGYFNPALTLALALNRKIDRTEAIFLATAQVLAGFAATGIGLLLHDCQTSAPIPLASGAKPLCAMSAEALGAFALGYAVISVRGPGGPLENTAQALSLGALLAVLSPTLGGLSAGTFNPVMAVCAPTMGMLAWENLWLALVAAFFGAAAAGTVAGIGEDEALESE